MQKVGGAIQRIDDPAAGRICPGGGTGGWLYESYFIFALPLSFLSAALVGIAMERTVIQWLYRRPLESLLATWGVSLFLQQFFRRVFGSNNVQVSSPSYLSDNWTFHDIIFGWNRVFVIGFAGHDRRFEAGAGRNGGCGKNRRRRHVTRIGGVKFAGQPLSRKA